MNGFTEESLRLDEYKETAKDCDLLLWRPTSWYGHVIARATNGPYSHISGVLDWSGSLWQVGYEEGKGGYGSPLAVAAQRWPGRMDVFRVSVNYDVALVAERMKARLGWEYKWGYIRMLALLNAPFFRWLDWSANIMRRAERSTAGGICSSHIATSFCEDEVFFQDGVIASEITPNDIYHSPITDYIGTLVA